VIKSLIEQNAPVDIFGVGTSLVTGQKDAALDGIYKLSFFDNKPRLKISEELEKIILPGRKNVFRLFDEKENFYGDAIVLADEDNVDKIYHPFQTYQYTEVKNIKKEILLNKVMEGGKITAKLKQPAEVATFVNERLKKLPEEHKRFINPHVYKVGISSNLLNLRQDLINNIRKKIYGSIVDS
jgi:nicotinate phosphoribosyltransferase